MKNKITIIGILFFTLITNLFANNCEIIINENFVIIRNDFIKEVSKQLSMSENLYQTKMDLIKKLRLVNCQMDQVCNFVEGKKGDILPLSCTILEDIYNKNSFDFSIKKDEMKQCINETNGIDLNTLPIQKTCKTQKLKVNQLLLSFTKQQFTFNAKYEEASFYIDKIKHFTKKLIHGGEQFTKMKIKIGQVFANIIDCDC